MVLKVVAGLYEDQLKPYGRLLRKRLVERGDVQLSSNDAGLAHLRSVCARSSKLHIQPAQGGEWIALFVDATADFVDVYCPEDRYPAALWRAAARYFESLDDADAKLPGGRFSCAECLLARQLPFLEGYSLGKVSHIVQLAISQKKILGYGNGCIVPYERSQSRLKEQAAQQRILFASDEDAQELPSASWAEVLVHMTEILGLQAGGVGEQVPLSSVKRIFRVQHRLELSETALGHAKLSELLQDPKLGGICTVRLLDTGYFVIPLLKDSQEESTQASSDVESSDWSSQDESVPGQWVIHNTFLHAKPLRESRRALSAGPRLSTIK